MAFGQIYKVLEMEPLPSNKQPQKYPWCDKEGGPTCLSERFSSAGRASSRLLRSPADTDPLAACFWTGLGLKRPYEDGAMDDKELIKKMKRNLRKGTQRDRGFN